MKSNEVFLEDLENSEIAVDVVEAWLEREGYDIYRKPSKVRPSFEERLEYADDGDLEIRKRIEVKHRYKIPFTNRGSYPYDTIFVDTVLTLDKTPKNQLSGYVIVNADRTHAALIHHSTRKTWTVERKFDPTYGRETDFYACPVENAKFVRITEVKDDDVRV